MTDQGRDLITMPQDSLTVVYSLGSEDVDADMQSINDLIGGPLVAADAAGASSLC